MDAVTFAESSDDFDRAVVATPPAAGIDPVCSSTRWILPAATAFAPRAEPRLYRSDHGFAAFIEHENPNGPVLTSLDPTWGFATPLVGDDPAAVIDAFWEQVLPDLDHYAVSVSGVDTDGPLHAALAAREPVGFTNTAERCVADLRDGFDAWLGRRSSRFRRSLRQSANQGERLGIGIEVARPDDAGVAATFERVLDIERRSWKTSAGSGLVDTDLGFFTAAMCRRFARTEDLLVLFARLDGRDLGYVIGGTVGNRYRGFQHSFDDDFREASIGKLLQFHTIATVAASGAEAYDMGMAMDYKMSYVDRVEATITLIFANRASVSG